MVQVNKSQNQLCLILEPNRSATWKQTYRFVFIVAIFVLVIAIGWSIAGAWMILPFAGIEIALLAYFMHRVTKSTYQQQQIKIDENDISILSNRVNQKVTLPRNTVSLIVVSSENVFDTCQLIFQGVDTKNIEFGEFLNQEDKNIIISHLQPIFPLRRTTKKSWSMSI